MFIDLQNVPEDGQAVDRVVLRETLPLNEDAFRFATDVRVFGQIHPVSDDRAYRLQGRLEGVLDVVCVRCLAAFRNDLSESLDLLYLPHSQNTSLDEPGASGAARVLSANDGAHADEEGRSLSADELAVAFYRDDRIDVAQMVFEQTLLSLPMKPLCRSDCAGLCPECGTNRNESACDCRPEESDPRWDGLKALLGP